MANRPQDAVVLIPYLEPDERLPRYVEAQQEKGIEHIVVVDDGSGPNIRPINEALAAMPGSAQYGLEALHEGVEELRACGVRACILFGNPKHKDHEGSSAADPQGIEQEAIRTWARTHQG